MSGFVLNPVGPMKNGVIFFDVSKTASTTTWEIFKPAVKASNGHQFGMHTPAKFIKQNYPKVWAKKYAKFTTIRNPYDRFVSHYIKWLSHPEEKVNLTEEKIRAHILENVYTKLQLEFISDDNGQILADEILVYENLKSDLQNFLDKCNIPMNITETLDKVYWQKTENKKDWRSYYDENPGLWEIATKIYERDILLWKKVSHLEIV